MRFRAAEGFDHGISGLVGQWTSTGASPLTVANDAMRAWPRRDRTLAAGRPALVFDGDDSLGAPGGMPAASCSRAIAFRIDDLTSGGILVGALAGDALRLKPGSALLTLAHNGVELTSSTPLATGVFHTAVTTYDAATGGAAIYLDGQRVAAGALPPPKHLQLVIGGSKYGGHALEGAIAELAIYTHALSDAERKGVEAELARFGDPAWPAVDFSHSPRDAQILQRDAGGTAQIRVEGMVRTPGYGRAALTVTRDGQPFASQAVMLAYGADGAPFTLSATLDAGFFDHTLTVSVVSGVPGAQERIVLVRENVCVGDAFLVDGQSNAVAKDWHGEGLGDAHQSRWIRSFGDARWVWLYAPPPLVMKGEHNKDLNWDVARSLVPHNHATIGQWALYMAETLMNLEQVPIAVINGASEGSSILSHVRHDAYPTDPSGLYGRLLYRAQQAEIAAGARAMIYYQGESDGLIPEAWGNAFASMHDDWLADYPSLERIYVFQVREGCNMPNDGVREIQRTLGDVYPDVSVMSTTAVPSHDICHYYHIGYLTTGKNIARMIARDIYGIPFAGVDPPRIVKAQWANAAHEALVLSFEPAGEVVHVDPGVAAHLSVNDGVAVASVASLGRAEVLVRFAGPSAATAVTWRGHAYDGPWIQNGHGIGALTFFDFPITAP
jgi:hypothetical protein